MKDLKSYTFTPAARVFFALLLMSGMLVNASTVHAQTGSRLLNNIPVVGEVLGGAAFDGRLSINDLSLNEAGELVASGVVRGTLDGQRVRQTFEDVVIGLSEGGNPAECDILFLDLGPIFLDLLGLQLDLSQITLDLTAVPGPGNLLGNLLCAVVGLLDGFDLSGVLGNVLNNLLDAINNLL